MAVIFQDSFDRADNTDLGPDWQEIGSDFGIISNSLHPGPYVNPVQCVYANSISTSDYAVEALCIFALESKKTPGVFLRGIWNSSTLRYDCYYASIYPKNQEIRLELYQNGVFSTIANFVDTTIDSTGGTAYTLRLEAQGTTLKVYLNGTLKISASDTTLSTGGYAGVMAGAASYSIGWDNFLLETLGGGAYSESISSSQIIFTSIFDVQKYKEVFVYTQYQINNSIDHQIFLEKLAYQQNQPITLSDLQFYLEKLGFNQLANDEILDLVNYLENINYVSNCLVVATDSLTSILNETLFLLQSISTSIQDKQHYKDILFYQQYTSFFENSIQTYVEHLQEIRQQVFGAQDLGHFIERVEFKNQNIVISKDWQHYQEILQAIFTHLISITERYASTITEMLQWLQKGDITREDIQHYQERILLLQGHLLNEREWAHFWEQIQIVEWSAINIVDIQQHLERLSIYLQQYLVDYDSQNFIEDLSLLMFSGIAGSDVYYPSSPPIPAYTFVKILKTVFEKKYLQTDFWYYGPQKNYFFYGGGGQLKKGILPRYITQEVATSEDGATDFDGAILHAPPRFLLENYYSGNTERASSIAGIIFRNIKIPKNTPIQVAQIYFWMEYRELQQLKHFRLFIMDGHQHSNFVDYPVVERPVLPIEVHVDITELPVDQYGVYGPIVADVTPMVQELVNNNWEYNGDMGFEMWPPLDDQGNKISGIIKIWDYDGGYPPRLEVSLS